MTQRLSAPGHTGGRSPFGCICATVFASDTADSVLNQLIETTVTIGQRRRLYYACATAATCRLPLVLPIRDRLTC
jgi:hypothetical protein